MSSVQSQAGSGIRGIFSSLSLEPRRPSQPPTLLLPADQLHAYLATAHVPNWTKWPVLPTSKGFFGKSKGFDAMSWEWKRRWQLAEEGRQFRTLRVWDVNREFEREALQFHQEKTPQHPIPFHDRWGKQIFALPAEGYETLEFFDEEANVADDHGLLSWLTNSLLATATSALHMTRFSSQSFSFHLIPAPYPPTPTSYVNERGTPKHCLWEGFGTLALVNRSQDSDRAMIIEIRPPSVVDSGVLNHFARQSRSEGWWHLPAELCVGDMGQANLLQAQVYDDCVSNHVFYFAVTNLKYWVFGRFNASYTMCTVSPIIERKQRNPSLMQCLTAWTISAYDDRPGADNPHVETPQPEPIRLAPTSQPVPPYSDPRAQAGSFSTLASSASSMAPLTPQGPMMGMNMGSGFMPIQNQGYPKFPPGYYDLPPSPFAPSPSPAPGGYGWNTQGYGSMGYGGWVNGYGYVR